ncbi:MAG: class I SAM-dependent methyltransferase [Verrucomicrobiota bacterium]
MSGEWDWQQAYSDGVAPWDTGRPSSELRRVVEGEGAVVRCEGRALDLGCGTGTQSLYLAERGFSVLGIDHVEAALEVARSRAAARDDLEIEFRLEDVLESGDFGEGFEFIFDRGCFHAFQGDEEAARYVATLERASKPGTVYLMLCGNAREEMEGGPPVLSEAVIRERLEPLFEIELIREFRFDRNDPEGESGESGPLAYACLMRRRAGD